MPDEGETTGSPGVRRPVLHPQACRSPRVYPERGAANVGTR